MVLLHYSHRPAVARSFNAFVAALAAGDSRLVPLGTVLPGEPDAEDIIREAAALGLRGIKLHCHVQGFAPDAPEVAPVWRACEALGLPVVIHAGREPYSPAYPVDARAVCGVERMERVLTAHPGLRVCGATLAPTRWAATSACSSATTTCGWTREMLARFFPVEVPDSVLQTRPERILYGSELPPTSPTRGSRARGPERTSAR